MDSKTLLYTKSHEWIAANGAKRRVGITQFAQEQLGDIVFVEFPDDGKAVGAGEEACIIESCKATASVYAPLGGKLVAFNRGLTETPEKINESPYEDGWLFEIEVTDDANAKNLLDAAAYEKYCREEA